MDKKSLQDLIEAERTGRNPGATVVLEDETHLKINDHPYELVMDHKAAFNKAELSDRFNSYYSKFDYLVGDWGFEQLRLRGFYANDRNVPAESKIEALEDFLAEKANLGCAYFVLHNLDVRQQPQKKSRKPADGNSRRRRSRNRRSTNKSTAHVREKAEPVASKPGKQDAGTVKTVGHNRRRHFTIREKKD
ncbi:YutD family protein [Secundilactobacillus kimchicus]|uniref:YutD family protein n=1 Tax=Secundilactobacillus kimchicus TaxID=528209 RepID=UPI0024A92941|nr:YutD family protein [Secundilactobacillus kimchicus]